MLERCSRPRELAQAELCCAVTGIAGPSGGSAEEPVGTRWGWARWSALAQAASLRWGPGAGSHQALQVVLKGMSRIWKGAHGKRFSWFKEPHQARGLWTAVDLGAQVIRVSLVMTRAAPRLTYRRRLRALHRRLVEIDRCGDLLSGLIAQAEGSPVDRLVLTVPDTQLLASPEPHADINSTVEVVTCRAAGGAVEVESPSVRSSFMRS